MGRTVTCPVTGKAYEVSPPPPYFSQPSQRAFEKGFVACVKAAVDQRQRGVARANQKYQRRYMRQSYLLGWDAAMAAINGGN